jgi:small GTP-binding protein
MTSPDSFKAVILGDSGVGKTSIVTRWMTGVFSCRDSPTIGANHQTKSVMLDGHEVEMFLWDTAGQEQFRSLTPLYVRSSSVAILTASITDRISFENLNVWIQTLLSSTDSTPPIILAVNKIDLTDAMELTQEEIDDKYRDRFAGLFFVSALQDVEIDNLFMAAAQAGYKFTLENRQKDKEPLMPIKVGERKHCSC